MALFDSSDPMLRGPPRRRRTVTAASINVETGFFSYEDFLNIMQLFPLLAHRIRQYSREVTTKREVKEIKRLAKIDSSGTEKLVEAAKCARFEHVKTVTGGHGDGLSEPSAPVALSIEEQMARFEDEVAKIECSIA
eukprot:SAG31_NODE_22257_length_530_cov_0.879350_1_plen_135_part_10